MYGLVMSRIIPQFVYRIIDTSRMIVKYCCLSRLVTNLLTSQAMYGLVQSRILKINNWIGNESVGWVR